jgi:molybdopterin-guanine dinucleotide biosynthesis protein A
VKLLGAVLAGGRSSRFGSDKAAALLHGRALIDHAVAAFAAQCEAVVVVGRDHPGTPSIPDRPRPDCGPLGGLAGAFGHALDHGFDTVLTGGVDSVGLPADLATRLAPAPAFLATQPVVGLWPATAGADAVAAIMASDGRHSMHAFATRIGARAVKLAAEPANVNTQADLDRLENLDGL